MSDTKVRSPKDAKKRGRPPMPKKDTSDEQSGDENHDGNEIVKRRVGRPPKNGVSAVYRKPKVTPEKRGPGRPPKVKRPGRPPMKKVKVDSSDGDEDDEIEEAVVVKKTTTPGRRGRPKKVKPVDDEDNND